MHGYASKTRTFETGLIYNRNIVDKNRICYLAVYNTVKGLGGSMS